jgi:hypothetical protein
MRTIPKRIQNAYFQLHKSRLIAKNHLDNDAIKHFEHILNSALPVNDYELNIYYFIKDLYYDDPSNFLNFISNSNKQSLILYTNNKNIINHFQLQYKVYINWDSKEKKYIVDIYNNNYSSSLSHISSFNSISTIDSNNLYIN